MSPADFEQIWGAMPFPAFVVDAYDRFQSVNSSAEHMIGKSDRQLNGIEIKRHFGPTSVVMDTIQQARNTAGSVTRYGVDVGMIDGEDMSCSIYLSFLHEPKGIILVILVPNGASMKISQSLDNFVGGRSITGLASMLAHEIRNPLAGITGAAQLLAMSGGANEEELSGMIADEARRIGELVERVEQFGDQRPVEFSPVNVHTVLDTAVRSAKAGFGQNLSFTLNYDPSLPDVSADPDQLMQVFQNLLKNACEAVDPARGHIRIQTFYNSGIKMLFAGRTRVNLPLQIDITDNGPGIPDNLIADIFEPFISTKTNGSGLGLSLVSKIMAAHGGLIDCHSKPGRTTFSLRLPLWKDKT
ncbi:MAG: ATP-binding protein [Pseudomonadota bacterium]